MGTEKWGCTVRDGKFTPTRTFAVLKSGEHQRAGIVLNVCPFCGERIDEMCRDVDEKETPTP